MPGFCNCGFMPPAVGWHPVKALERILRERHRHNEEQRHDTERPRDVRHHGAILVAIGEHCHRRVERHDERPEQQRPFLTGPERREQVHLRQVRTRERGDELEREVVREERRPQADGGQEGEAERGVHGPFAALDEIRAALEAARKRHRGRPGRHEQGDPERQLTNENHDALGIFSGCFAPAGY